MSKMAFVKSVVTTGGFLFLCVGPRLALGQLSQPSATGPAQMKAALTARNRSTGLTDVLEGLTLADDQKAKIAQIREQTKSQLTAVANDKNLSPEAADAMRRGYERIENGKILEVLTPEQQTEVRKRIAAWRAKTEKPQYPLRQFPASK